MKIKFQFCTYFLLFIFIISFMATSSRLLLSKQDLTGINLTEMTADEVSVLQQEDMEWFKLMGMEVCHGDAECLRRRMVSEVHLDYIYTQHHKH